jgi:ribose-phosphate pyrophosphokinase
VVVSPDPGGVKRAQLFREMLETVVERPVDAAFMEKRRSAGVVSGEVLVGPVNGATVLIIDDLISTGGTMARAGARLPRQWRGTTSMPSRPTGCSWARPARLSPIPVCRRRLRPTRCRRSGSSQHTLRDHLEIVSAASLFGEAIRRLHEGGSINELLEGSA